jgi:hypothetical protein
MPVPAAITDLSQSAASNSPLGSESPATADDYFRAYASFIAMLRDGKGASAEVNVASAATCDIGTVDSPFVRITGNTTITSFGTNYSGPRFLRFAGAVTLTHSATLALPGSANLTTTAGETCTAFPIGSPATGWTIQGLAGAQITGKIALYGIGTVASVAIADLDDATTPSGIYSATGATIGTNPVSVGAAGTVVHNISGGSGAQIFISTTTTRTFVRRRTGSAWQTWEELAALSGATFTGPLVSAAIGPTAGRQHALPSVVSDTIALIGQVNGFTAQQSLLAGYSAAAINYDFQPAHVSYSAGSTITAADLLTKIIRFTGAAGTVTMPTAANIDTANGLSSTNRSFDFSVINTGSGLCTVASNTGITTPIGALTLAADTSGVFRMRRTAANTYSMYRIS